MSGEYDYRKNIGRIIEDFGALFNGIVISTWKGTGFSEYPWGPNVHYLESEDVRNHKDVELGLGNRRRQVYSTYYGLRYVKERLDSEYVVKIRSDLYADLKSIVEHIRETDRAYDAYVSFGQKGFLYFLGFFRNNPYVVNDFIVGGRLSDMEKFFEASRYYEYNLFRYNNSFSEGDMVQKYMYYSLKKYLKRPAYRFFPYLKKHATSRICYKMPMDVLTMWGEVLTHSFCFFPHTVSKSILWKDTSWYEKALRGSPWAGYYEDWISYRNDVKTLLVEKLADLYTAKIYDVFYHYLPERFIEAYARRNFPLLSKLFRSYRSIKDSVKKPIHVGWEV